MKMSLITTTSIILLAAPFIAVAADISLDDAYSYESLSAFDAPTVHNANILKQDVSASEMYAWEVRDSYEFNLSGPSSSERAEIAVFSEKSVDIEPTALPSYTGDYDQLLRTGKGLIYMMHGLSRVL